MSNEIKQPSYWTRKADAQKYADKLARAYCYTNALFTIDRDWNHWSKRYYVMVTNLDNGDVIRVRKHRKLMLPADFF